MSVKQIKNNKNKGGVKTIKGKAISRYNAQKHGILRETITEYEQNDIQAIYNDLAVDLQPQGKTQELLVEIIASNMIRLQCIATAEGEFVRESMSMKGFIIGCGLDTIYPPTIATSKVDKLLIYSRYQTAAENRIYRALFTLKQLKSHE